MDGRRVDRSRAMNGWPSTLLVEGPGFRLPNTIAPFINILMHRAIVGLGPHFRGGKTSIGNPPGHLSHQYIIIIIMGHFIKF